ncbi:MAG TPA: hypothetical protein VF459_00850 [Caulobacteraceae bacterium]
MTPGEGLVGSALPTLAAVILVGGGLIGAALKPAARAWAERWVLMPAGLLLLLAALTYEVMRQNWIWAAIPMALLVLWGLRLRMLLRKTDPASAASTESDPKGTGTKE